MLQSVKPLGAAVFLCAAGAAPGSPALSQTTLDEIVQAAAAEGEVILDTQTTRFPPRTGANLSRALSGKFGIELDVVMTNSAPAPVMAGRLIEEAKAGVKPPADLIAVPLFLTQALDAGGVIADVDWAGMGVEADLVSPAGNSILMNVIPRAVVYNVNMVSEEDVPTRLEDLLDPKWQGKIAGPGFGGAYAMISVPVLGEERAAEWLRTLYVDQDMAVFRSMTDVPNRVGNGEFMIGMGVPANYSGLVDKGAPIANAPLEKVSSQPYYSFVIEGAENPKAGALLAYFMCCTEEGRQVVLENMGWATFDTVGSEQNDIGKEGRGIVPDPEWQMHDQDRVGKRFDTIIGR